MTSIHSAFLQGLKETGYVEGQNVAIEYRYADNQLDRLPAIAADLVRRRVAVIVASADVAALAAKAATTTIPIVFVTGGDPVALGLVASLNRPGGNLTGSALLMAELAPKLLQLLRELMPNAAVFGVLADPAVSYTPSAIADLQAAARTLGLKLVVLNARTDSDLETAFATFSQQRVGAVLVGASTFHIRRTEQLAAMAARRARLSADRGEPPRGQPSPSAGDCDAGAFRGSASQRPVGTPVALGRAVFCQGDGAECARR